MSKTSSKTHDIRKLVQEKYEASLTPNVLDLVDPIVASIPDEDLRGYLAETLRIGGVYTIMANYRRKNLGAVTSEPTLEDLTEGEAVEETQKKSPYVASPKLALGRLHWKKFLHTSIPTESGFKFLRDATRLDVQYQASRRRNSADSLVAEAEKWDRIDAIMEQYGASRVGDLPESALRKVSQEKVA